MRDYWKDNFGITEKTLINKTKKSERNLYDDIMNYDYRDYLQEQKKTQTVSTPPAPKKSYYNKSIFTDFPENYGKVARKVKRAGQFIGEVAKFAGETTTGHYEKRAELLGSRASASYETEREKKIAEATARAVSIPLTTGEIAVRFAGEVGFSSLEAGAALADYTTKQINRITNGLIPKSTLSEDYKTIGHGKASVPFRFRFTDEVFATTPEENIEFFGKPVGIALTALDLLPGFKPARMAVTGALQKRKLAQLDKLTKEMTDTRVREVSKEQDIPIEKAREFVNNNQEELIKINNQAFLRQNNIERLQETQVSGRTINDIIEEVDTRPLQQSDDISVSYASVSTTKAALNRARRETLSAGSPEQIRVSAIADTTFGTLREIGQKIKSTKKITPEKLKTRTAAFNAITRETLEALDVNIRDGINPGSLSDELDKILNKYKNKLGTPTTIKNLRESIKAVGTDQAAYRHLIANSIKDIPSAQVLNKKFKIDDEVKKLIKGKNIDELRLATVKNLDTLIQKAAKDVLEDVKKTDLEGRVAERIKDIEKSSNVGKAMTMLERSLDDIIEEAGNTKQVERLEAQRAKENADLAFVENKDMLDPSAETQALRHENMGGTPTKVANNVVEAERRALTSKDPREFMGGLMRTMQRYYFFIMNPAIGSKIGRAFSPVGDIETMTATWSEHLDTLFRTEEGKTGALKKVFFDDVRVANHKTDLYYNKYIDQTIEDLRVMSNKHKVTQEGLQETIVFVGLLHEAAKMTPRVKRLTPENALRTLITSIERTGKREGIPFATKDKMVEVAEKMIDDATAAVKNYDEAIKRAKNEGLSKAELAEIKIQTPSVMSAFNKYYNLSNKGFATDYVKWFIKTAKRENKQIFEPLKRQVYLNTKGAKEVKELDQYLYHSHATSGGTGTRTTKEAIDPVGETTKDIGGQPMSDFTRVVSEGQEYTGAARAYNLNSYSVLADSIYRTHKYVNGSPIFRQARKTYDELNNREIDDIVRENLERRILLNEGTIYGGADQKVQLKLAQALTNLSLYTLGQPHILAAQFMPMYDEVAREVPVHLSDLGQRFLAGDIVKGINRGDFMKKLGETTDRVKMRDSMTANRVDTALHNVYGKNTRGDIANDRLIDELDNRAIVNVGGKKANLRKFGKQAVTTAFQFYETQTFIPYFAGIMLDDFYKKFHKLPKNMDELFENKSSLNKAHDLWDKTFGSRLEVSKSIAARQGEIADTLLGTFTSYSSRVAQSITSEWIMNHRKLLSQAKKGEHIDTLRYLAGQYSTMGKIGRLVMSEVLYQSSKNLLRYHLLKLIYRDQETRKEESTKHFLQNITINLLSLGFFGRSKWMGLTALSAINLLAPVLGWRPPSFGGVGFDTFLGSTVSEASKLIQSLFTETTNKLAPYSALPKNNTDLLNTIAESSFLAFGAGVPIRKGFTIGQGLTATGIPNIWRGLTKFSKDAEARDRYGRDEQFYAREIADGKVMLNEDYTANQFLKDVSTSPNIEKWWNVRLEAERDKPNFNIKDFEREFIANMALGIVQQTVADETFKQIGNVDKIRPLGDNPVNDITSFLALQDMPESAIYSIYQLLDEAVDLGSIKGIKESVYFGDFTLREYRQINIDGKTIGKEAQGLNDLNFLTDIKVQEWFNQAETDDEKQEKREELETRLGDLVKLGTINEEEAEKVLGWIE